MESNQRQAGAKSATATHGESAHEQAATQHSEPGSSALNEMLVRYAELHATRAEVREEGDVAVFCDCTVPDAGGRRLACEINVVRTFGELRDLLGY